MVTDHHHHTTPLGGVDSVNIVNLVGVMLMAECDGLPRREDRCCDGCHPSPASRQTPSTERLNASRGFGFNTPAGGSSQMSKLFEGPTLKLLRWM